MSGTGILYDYIQHVADIKVADADFTHISSYVEESKAGNR
jgi:hypothetical protein